MSKYFCEEQQRWYYCKDYAKRRRFHKNTTLERYHTGVGVTGKTATKEEWKERTKKWQRDNRERFKDYQKNYYKKRRKDDPHFKILHNLRTRMTLALRSNNITKRNKMVALLGCSVDDFKKYLESKFLPGMNWENHSRKGWHIDHIIPCCYFDLTKLTHQIMCFNYQNLTPLWANDNLKKLGLDKKIAKKTLN